MLQLDSDRQVCSLSRPMRIPYSPYLDHLDESGFDLETTLPWMSYNVTKEHDIALFIAAKISCSISVFRLEISMCPNNYWMDCHELLDGHSWSAGDWDC